MSETQAGPLVESPVFGSTRQAYICSECAELCSLVFERAERAGSFDSAAIKEDVDRFLTPLSELERRVVQLRHGLKDGYSYSLAEVGRILDMNPEEVRGIDDRAVEELKRPRDAV